MADIGTFSEWLKDNPQWRNQPGALGAFERDQLLANPPEKQRHRWYYSGSNGSHWVNHTVGGGYTVDCIGVSRDILGPFGSRTVAESVSQSLNEALELGRVQGRKQGEGDEPGT